MEVISKYEAKDADRFIQLETSVNILKQWIIHHALNESELSKDIHKTFDDRQLLILSGNRHYSGHENIVDSLFEISKHFETVVEEKAVFKNCLDMNVLYVKHYGYPSGQFLNSLTCRNVPCILLLLIASDCSEGEEQFNHVSEDDGIMYYNCTQSEPFVWFDAVYLNPEMWKSLLSVQCYGCTVNHPSQKHHMGIGGCLNNVMM